MGNIVELLSSTLIHFVVTAAGVAIAIVIGVSLGVLISKKQALSGPVLSIADIIQTVPSLALLAILMIFFGLGNTTLIVGLALYSLLPIIRNTYTGIMGVSPSIKEAAKGMGFSQVQSLLKVEIPLALPMILSGIRIAFVTALGTAVIGVLIGAQGLGEIIYYGIQSLDWAKIIYGTIPVVLLSLIAQFLFNKLQHFQKRENKHIIK